MTSIGERLKIVRGEVIRDVYAPQIGVSKTTIANYETGKRLPDHGFLLRILEVHPEINPAWLLTGEGTKTKTEKKQHSVSQEQPQLIAVDVNGLPQIPRWQNPDPEMFDYVPMAAATLSAGGGSFVLSEEIEGYYAFRNSWLNSVATSKRNLIMMRVTGDSMAPTLQSGDAVLIDIGKREIKDGAVYALRVDSTIIIKRLTYRVGGKVVIISDNRNEFESYEANPADVHVIGQVIFFSRVLIQE